MNLIRVTIRTAKHISQYRNLSQQIHHSKSESHALILCRLGRFDEALQALSSNLTPSLPSTYSSLLQLCIDSNARKEGRALHDHLFANGYAPDLHLSTKFVIFYAKIGDVGAARKMFDRMPERSIVSWTAMISGYAQNGCPSEALEAFSLMYRSGFAANQFTYGSALRACATMGCIRSGEQIQGCVAKSRFAKDLFVESSLVNLHLKCGLFEDACCLFGRMEQKDVVTLNSMIRGYADRGLGDDAFRLFCKMLRDGLLPDQFTFGSVLRACSVVRNILGANQFHGFIFKSGYENHCVVNGSLIDAYAKCRSMGSARLLYDSMLEHDLISCTALITGYSQERSCSVEALDLFCKISRMGMRVDGIILCSMLSICADEALLSLGQQIHVHTFKNQPNCDLALGNALVDMYAKSGVLQDARRAFDEMQHKNVISWTSLITGYGKHGCVEGAETLFMKMEDDGVKPNDVTFLSLLSACSHSGLTSKGMDYFYSMISKYKIHPRAEHYSCAIDLLARGGQFKEAYDFVCKMNVTPSKSLWGAILGACRMHGNTSLGEVAARHLFYLNPDESVNYVVLANIYAVSGLWVDTLKVRKLMEVRTAKKGAGCSYI